MKISATVITFNEEKNIQRCLESLEGIVEEVIIVDSFSTDNTKKICEKFNIKFYEREFIGYSNQKNWAIEKAKYDIILAIDADEALDIKLKKSISNIKDKWKLNGYYFNRKTNYCGQWINFSGWYPNKQLRLFNKNKGSWNDNLVHEKVNFYKKTKIGYLNGNLLHYSFRSRKQHLQQIDRFSELKAEMLSRDGKNTNIIKIIFSPIIKFFSSFILKLGFLDGYCGFIICLFSAYSKYLCHIKLISKNNEK
jgi:glycosyltransferase involved in cell wall biosynthesis